MTDTAPKDPTAAEATGGDNAGIAGDVAERGIQKNKAEFQEDLRWWFRWAHIERRPTMSQAEAAEMLGIDAGTYSKVFRGEYKNAQQLVLPPPAKMLSRIRVLRDQEKANVAELNKGRVMCPTVAEIHMVIRKAWNDRQLAFVFGESRLMKTESALWFRDENNHGATLYVDLQGCNGVQDVWRAFARALKLEADVAPAKLMPRVLASIDRTNLVLVDEFHHVTWAHQKGSSNKMVNALKSIKDRCGCGMVIFSTNAGRDEFDPTKGREAQLLKQLWRRGVIKLQLPEALRVGDVRAFAVTYGLSFPAESDTNDTWANLGAEHSEFEGLKLCEDVAYNYGVEHLITLLRDGSKVAKKRGRELQWKDVKEAQAVYDRLAAKKTV